MINERILNEEFFQLLDIIQNKLNWEMSLGTFDITNASLAQEFMYNNSLEQMSQELMNSKKGLSFLMVGYKAIKSEVRTREVLMRYASRLGYAIHQLDIIDISSYDGAITYDDEFNYYQVDNYFELIADFLCDDYMTKQLGISNLHHESFIYFAMIIGYLIRSQIQKHSLRSKFKLDVIKTRQNSWDDIKIPGCSCQIIILPFESE